MSIACTSWASDFPLTWPDGKSVTQVVRVPFVMGDNCTVFVYRDGTTDPLSNVLVFTAA
jgi:hypothetical protein